MPALGIKDVASMQPGRSPRGRKKMATECPGDECQASNSGHDAAITFTVGEKFNSVQEFDLKLEAYKKQAFVEFWRRDSRTITAARKRGVDRPLKADLKYYDLKYCCVHGGRVFKPRGKGSRCTS